MRGSTYRVEGICKFVDGFLFFFGWWMGKVCGLLCCKRLYLTYFTVPYLRDMGPRQEDVHLPLLPKCKVIRYIRYIR